jgi:hypothetical protein
VGDVVLEGGGREMKTEGRRGGGYDEDDKEGRGEGM